MRVDKNLHKLLTLWVRPIPKTWPMTAPASQSLEQDTTDSVILRPEHSLVKPYRDSMSWSKPDWALSGNAKMTSHFIRLTEDHSHQHGALWNAVPLSMENWIAELNFRIHGKRKHGFGDGLTFWLTKDRPSSKDIYEKDYTKNFDGLAVNIDTHNDQHRHGDSFISAVIQSRDGNRRRSEILGSYEARLRNLYHNPWIQIAFHRNFLTVSMNNDGRDDWVQCFRVGGIVLPQNYFLGCSAKTSEESDAHEVMELNTYEIE